MYKRNDERQGRIVFDNNQLEQYRSVKAPDELRSSVMKIEKTKSAKIYSFPKKVMPAVAACFAVIIAVGAFFTAQNSIGAEIVQPDFQVASLYRSVNRSVMIQVDAGKESAISVSDGSFTLEEKSEMLTSANISGKAFIEWHVDLQEENILTVKKGLIVRQYRLVFDEETQILQLEKE